MHGQSYGSTDDTAQMPVSITMSILAVLIALVAALSHRAHTHAILAQNRAAAEWVYYESRVAGQAVDDSIIDLLSVTQLRDAVRAAKVQDKYKQRLERKKQEEKQFEASADALEIQIARHEAAANRFDLGNVCLEAALVITSVTLLTKRRLFWLVGIGIAFAGIATAITGAFIARSAGY
jgi:hypothetical protein